MTRVTTPPGEILLEEFLKPLGMTMNALAIELRVPATRIAAIVHGHRAVTVETALRLARYFGTTPGFWLNLQTNHDLSRGQAELAKRVEAEVQPRAA